MKLKNKQYFKKKQKQQILKSLTASYKSRKKLFFNNKQYKKNIINYNYIINFNWLLN